MNATNNGSSPQVLNDIYLGYMPCILVDWSGDWATPWGSQRHR